MWEDEEDEYTESSSNGSQLAHQPHVSMSLAAAPEDAGIMGRLVAAAQGLARDQGTMITRAKQIGGLLGTAGFYRFPAGGSTVEGPSIDMAQALAQEWGAIIYQVRVVHTEILSSGGQRVHLRASVADMKSLVCAEVDQVVSTAPPPGKFAEKADQSERWHGMQIQSAASKIVRNAILRVLPEWYVGPAFKAAKAADGDRALGGKKLPEARYAAAEALNKLGATTPELEVWLGQPYDMWAVPQISELRKLFGQLNSNVLSIEAWRAGVAAKTDQQPTAPRKSALGLSAPGETLNGALKAATEQAQPAAQPEPAKAKRGSKSEPAQQSLTGDGEPPANVKLAGEEG